MTDGLMRSLAGHGALQNYEKLALRKQYEPIGASLLAMRRRQRITQSALAQQVGMSQSALARIEGGKGNPTLKTIAKLAAALNLQLVVLPKQPQSVKLKKT